MGYVKLAHYSLAYKRIKTKAFDGSGTQSTVLIFVAADVDALCAFRILTSMLKSDSISYVVVPVATMEDVRAEALAMGDGIKSIIMLNCGAIVDLEDYIELKEDVAIYVMDSHRPINLKNAFWNNEVIVFHETDLDRELTTQKEALLFIEESEYDPDEDEEDNDEEQDEDEDSGDEDGHGRNRRRRTGQDSEVVLDQTKSSAALKRQWQESRSTIVDYMSQGGSFGTSIANQCYMIASQLNRTTNDMLWLAIVGLTAQYTNEQIGNREYLEKVQMYRDESERLNPAAVGQQGSVASGAPQGVESLLISSPEDGSIRCADEYRFMMIRHWSLYESMYHSHYVASKLGVWRDRGRKRLKALLAKMGFSLEQCNQVFTHMDIDLKKILKEKMETVAPGFNLHDIFYTSFTRNRGYRGTMCASDIVYSVTALLETSPKTAVTLEMKVEWALDHDGPLSVPGPPATGGRGGDLRSLGSDDQVDLAAAEATTDRPEWWHANFFRACDALESSDDRLMQGLTSSMKIQQAVVRQGIAIIDKQVIKTLSTYRLATLNEGPDFSIFTHPLTITKLSQFLVHAIREYGGGEKSVSRPIPFVLAVLKEATQTYIVAGVHGAPNGGEVIPNKFGVAFEKISFNEEIPIKYIGFDKSVIEMDKDDFVTFLGHLSRYLKK